MLWSHLEKISSLVVLQKKIKNLPSRRFEQSFRRGKIPAKRGEIATNTPLTIAPYISWATEEAPLLLSGKVWGWWWWWETPFCFQALGHGRVTPPLHLQHISCSPRSPSDSKFFDNVLIASNEHGTSPLEFISTNMKILQNLSKVNAYYHRWLVWRERALEVVHLMERHGGHLQPPIIYTCK